MEGTYHRITFAGTSLPIRKQAAMIALPGIVEDLLPQRLIHLLLISIIASWLCAIVAIAIFVLEAVVGPETVIEGK